MSVNGLSGYYIQKQAPQWRHFQRGISPCKGRLFSGFRSRLCDFSPERHLDTGHWTNESRHRRPSSTTPEPRPWDISAISGLSMPCRAFMRQRRHGWIPLSVSLYDNNKRRCVRCILKRPNNSCISKTYIFSSYWKYACKLIWCEWYR